MLEFGLTHRKRATWSCPISLSQNLSSHTSRLPRFENISRTMWMPLICEKCSGPRQMSKKWHSTMSHNNLLSAWEMWNLKHRMSSNSGRVLTFRPCLTPAVLSRCPLGTQWSKKIIGQNCIILHSMSSKRVSMAWHDECLIFQWLENHLGSGKLQNWALTIIELAFQIFVEPKKYNLRLSFNKNRPKTPIRGPVHLQDKPRVCELN